LSSYSSNPETDACAKDELSGQPEQLGSPMEAIASLAQAAVPRM